MLILSSGAAGFVIGLAVYWLKGRSHRANAQQLWEDNHNLRHVISELSLYKYGSQK